MSKREHHTMNGAEDSGGSRHKRRREAVASSDVEAMFSDPIEPSAASGDPELLREQGLKLLQTVKDAVNKEGIVISTPFLRKPPKKQFADYYVYIKQPIALDDIKKKLDSNSYASLDEVKNDFELLFANARQYNVAESVIVQDANYLLKLMHKTYNKMVPSEEDGENGKAKIPNLSRLMKSRLDKLVAKEDSTGRVLSIEFMILPSKKLWPIYYKEIKRPQCFENIFKHIKRKEYQTSAEFAADVELVFSNALAFNQDGTQIWNDATTLKEYFRHLMSDLPPPHNLPEYSKPSNKIKIKPPQAAQQTPSTSTLSVPKPELPSSVLLRVPATSKTTPHVPPTVPKAKSPLPVSQPSTTQVSPAPKLPVAQAKTQVKAPTPHPPIQQTVSFINATSSHYPRVPYIPPNATAPSPAPPPVTNAISNAPSTSQSPAPVDLSLNHQLKSIHLRIQPEGRSLTLDHQSGVKTWALWLTPGETSVIVSNVYFLGENVEEEGSEDEDHDEDEDADMDVDIENDEQPSPKNGRKKGKGRGRGRPPKASVTATKAAQAAKVAKLAKKKETSKIGDLQLKLNKFVVKEHAERSGEWNVYLPVGQNTIEVGETGGMIWKIYVNRQGDV